MSDYSITATGVTPALVIYLIDVSTSMDRKLGNARRIDIVHAALGRAIETMVSRSTRGRVISPRYRLAMYAYSDDVYDLLDGTKTIDVVAHMGLPDLNLVNATNTHKALSAAERLLQQELPNLVNSPAPLVCHMTDGVFTGEDPVPVAQRIMKMRVPDGNVLIENIFISDRILTQPMGDTNSWQGISAATPLADEYAKTLRRISSPLPSSYRSTMFEHGYHPSPEALMMLPGMSPELVEMGFVMSSATGVGQAASAPPRQIER